MRNAEPKESVSYPPHTGRAVMTTLRMAVLLAAVVCLPAVAGMQMPKPKQEPFFIGVAGGTASGKTSVVDKVVKALRHESVVSITMDCFYRDLTDAERDRAHACDFDFDHPNAVRHGRHLNPELTDLQPRLILARLPTTDPASSSVSSTSTTCSR